MKGYRKPSNVEKYILENTQTMEERIWQLEEQTWKQIGNLWEEFTMKLLYTREFWRARTDETIYPTPKKTVIEAVTINWWSWWQLARSRTLKRAEGKSRATHADGLNKIPNKTPKVSDCGGKPVLDSWAYNGEYWKMIIAE